MTPFNKNRNELACSLRILPFRLSFGSTAKSISQRHKISLKQFNIAKSQVRNELDSFHLCNILVLVVDLCNSAISMFPLFAFYLCYQVVAEKAK